MTNREADARSEVEDFRGQVANQPLVLKPESPATQGRLKYVNKRALARWQAKPPVLTEQEQVNAATALRESLQANQIRYPLFAQEVINDPTKIWLMAEIQMMVSPEPDEVSYTFTGELSDAITNTLAGKNRYKGHMNESQTQQLFWHEYANTYGEEERFLFMDTLSQLSPEGADRIAAMGLAWADNQDMEDEENKAQLLLNMFNWAHAEKQHELGREGTLGRIGEFFDAPQEFMEQNVVQPALDLGITLLSGAEEAARRKALTPGQKLAYQFGLRPPDDAGEWGAWRLVSGTFDAWVEIGADPLNAIAGVGLGTKAAQTLPLTNKAIQAGRATMLARSLLPRWFSGSAARGGRVARMTYALTAKNVDELMDQTLKNGVAQQAFDLIKSNNPARFEKMFPEWSHMTDEMWRTIQDFAESPEEFIQVLKSGAINDVTNTGRTVEQLSNAFEEAKVAASNYVPRVDVTGVYTPAQLRRMDALANFKATSSTALDDATARMTMGAWADDVKEGDRVLGTFQVGDQTLTAKLGGRTSRLTGDERPIWYAVDESGSIKGGYDGTHLLRDEDVAGQGFMSSLLRTTEEGGESFLPRLIERAESTKINSFTEDGAAFLRKAIKERRGGDYGSLLDDATIPRDVRLNLAKSKLALDTHNTKANRVFFLADMPKKSKTFFNWDNVMKTEGTGRLPTGVRRVAARMTPGRPDDVIDLFSDRKGSVQLTRLFEHFGVRQDTIDDLLKQFQELGLGARQDWFWDSAMRKVGEELGVPAYQYNLIQYYKNTGIRKFSASGADTYIDAAGKAQKMPILSNQMTRNMPVPLAELDQVFRRARSIGNRSKIARAMGWNGRGINATVRKGAESSYKNREAIVKRLRTQLGDRAEDFSDDQLWQMAYSTISPATGLDGRGWIAGTLMPKAGSQFNRLHQWFTRAMLIFRPVQWAFRVAGLEEPMRAHIMNMSSMYTNPLQYMADLRGAHYVSRLKGWSEANAAWGQDLYNVVTKGAGKDELVKRLTDMNLLNEIPEAASMSLPQLRHAVSGFIRDALYGRTRVTKLDPVKRVPWAVRNRATNISRAERALQKHGMPTDFDFIRDAEEINNVIMRGYLGEAVGAADRKLYQFEVAMTQSEAFTHGQVYGANLINMAEDTYGNMALRRVAASLRGSDDLTGVDAAAIVNSSRWDLMKHDLSIRFPDAVDDMDLATRYMDEMLSAEVEHLFRPFLDAMEPEQVADMLDDFAHSHRLVGNIDGQDIDWDLRGANFGGGLRQTGDFVAANKNNPTIAIPSDLPAPSLDGRFMAHDDKGFIKKSADWVMQTFGERATQEINRRPAFMREHGRWFRHYTNIGIPEDTARRLARDHAAQMTNYVFFNMDEAPYYAAKLNQYIPFFGATYEVMATWSYKMPVAVGGSWPVGVGEFTRKFQRLMDAFVNTGLVTREEGDDGAVNYVLNLVPPDSDSLSNNEVGAALQGAGFKAVNTLDQVISTILGLEEGLELRSQGYRLAVGHPLNPEDYGILSYAQAHVGLNPATNIVVSNLAALIPGATGPQRTAVTPGETLADISDRLNMDVNDIVRYNREVFVDTEGFGSSELYNRLLGGLEDPMDLALPAGTVLNLPESSLYDAFSDVFMPFGEVNNPVELAVNYLPGSFRWIMGGLALRNQPSDEFWKGGDMTGAFGGMLPHINKAQVASQLNESFMFLEAHDLVDGKGPLERIMEKEQRLAQLVESGKTEEANALRSEVQLDTEAFLSRVQKTAWESLILRGTTGQLLPTSPGHVRKEQELIQQFWSTREYADSLIAGEGEMPKLRNFKSMEEVENYYEQLAAWLQDPTGDAARAHFMRSNPQLMAYLTPKTFYKEPVPDINSYEEYQKQIESGQREPAPLHISLWRARSAAIQADYYNQYIARFGNDPMQAAANALHQREEFSELQDERNVAYQGLEMWDDMHGSVYDNWRKEQYEDTETWAQDKIVDKLNDVRDNLSILHELEDALEVELDLEGISNLNQSVRAAISEISGAIREYNELMDNQPTRNAYEDAINRYFEEVYIPYSEQISDLYDQLPEVADSERQSLIYEQIKFLNNQFAGSTVFLDDNYEVPFPNPLEYIWQGKPEEEQAVKVQQWLTRPLEWIDQDQALRILESAPEMIGYLPMEDGDFDIYREFTLARIELDEMFEANEITRSQRNKGIKNLDEQLRQRLISADRKGEVVFMDMTPFEKLELSGQLPDRLGIFGDHVRYYKQALEGADETAGTVKGRLMTAPLYDAVEQAFFTDPLMRQTLQQLGVNLQDDDTMDTFLPWLFFGYTGER